MSCRQKKVCLFAVGEGFNIGRKGDAGGIIRILGSIFKKQKEAIK